MYRSKRTPDEALASFLASLSETPARSTSASGTAADEGGGGIFNTTGGTVSLSTSRLGYNTVASNGGGILNHGTMTITITLIPENDGVAEKLETFKVWLETSPDDSYSIPKSSQELKDSGKNVGDAGAYRLFPQVLDGVTLFGPNNKIPLNGVSMIVDYGSCPRL